MSDNDLDSLVSLERPKILSRSHNNLWWSPNTVGWMPHGLRRICSTRAATSLSPVSTTCAGYWRRST